MSIDRSFWFLSFSASKTRGGGVEEDEEEEKKEKKTLKTK
jgi:hypothetical protein